jgi:hypothetical protein
MWILDHFEDVISDLSVFHRIDDWERIPSSRFFAFAERLPAYEGAVRAALMAKQVPTAASSPDREVSEHPSVDVATVAAMSKHPGFPGIEYVGG